MSTFTTDEDDTPSRATCPRSSLWRSRPSLNELNRLAIEATTEPRTTLGVDLALPGVRGADVAAQVTGTERMWTSS